VKFRKGDLNVLLISICDLSAYRSVNVVARLRSQMQLR
jgi:hypothetical protein